MIFSTMKEREEAFETIRERKPFKDLTESQNDFIEGMYEALQCVSDMADEYLIDTVLNKMVSEIKKEAVADMVKTIELTIAEFVVSFRDDNALTEEGEEDVQS